MPSKPPSNLSELRESDEYKNLMEQMTALRTERDTLRVKVQSIEPELEAVQQDLSVSKSQVRDLNQQLTAMEGKLSATSSDLQVQKNLAEEATRDKEQALNQMDMQKQSYLSTMEQIISASPSAKIALDFMAQNQ